MANEEPPGDPPEPTVDEIIANIRRIIAENDAAEEAARNTATPQPKPAARTAGRRFSRAGPQVRDTDVHRRIRWMKVDVGDLEEISEYSRDDIVPGAIAGFVLSGTLWLGVDKWISDGFSIVVFLLFCVSFVSAAVVWWSWRKLGQSTKRLQKLLASIEEEEPR